MCVMGVFCFALDGWERLCAWRVICNADEIGMPQELKRGAVQVGEVLLKVR